MKSTINNTQQQHGTIARDPDGAGALAPGSSSMSTRATNTTSDDEEETADDLLLEAPLFRSVASPHFDYAVAPLGHATVGFGKKYGGFDAAWAAKLRETKEPKGLNKQTERREESACGVSSETTFREWMAHALDGVYVLPCYYPRCKNRSAISNQAIESLLERLYCCFKKLSIQARLDKSFATFGFVLRTAEHLELSLLIWYDNKSRSSLYIEVDKRQAGGGCGGVFPLQYICRILKAVQCAQQELEDETFGFPELKELQRGNEGMHEGCRQMDLMVGPCPAPQTQEFKAPTPLNTPNSMSVYGLRDQAMSSLEMVWGLMRSPVTWSTALELLGTISNPSKSGVESSVVVSKVILLGRAPVAYGEDCCRSIHKKLASLLKSLAGDSKDPITERLSAYQKDCLLQLVLTCLVSAMEVHAKFVTDGISMDACPETPEANGSSASTMSEFLESTKDVVACDVLETLLVIVRRANTKPHHAYLAVKALFLLSSENTTIRQYVALAMASDINPENISKSQRCAVLKRAQEVGTQSHGLLEAECERLQRVLESRH